MKKGIISLLTLMLVISINCAAGQGGLKVEVTNDSETTQSAKRAAQKSLDETLGQTVQAVNVTIEKITVRHKTDEGNETVTITDEAKAVNLLDVLGNATEEIGSTDLEAGDYTEIRIQVAEDNTIVFEGDETEYALKIPSGTSSGIKIKTSFAVVDGEDTELVLDFNAAESITEKGQGEYNLSPVIKVKEKKEPGEEDE